MLMPVTIAAIFAPNPVPPEFLERSGAALAMRPTQLRADAEDLAALRPFLEQESKRYADIRVPTVVITGDADRILSPQKQSRAMAAAVPGARLVVLPGVGHMPQYARPAQVLAEIEGLIDQVNHAPDPTRAADTATR
jgi:pimeloyl-ACP methyl ester carboxylesterase